MPFEFRDEFYYMNNFFGTATYAAETLSGGVPWEELLAEKILQPLGMADTTLVHVSEDKWDEFAKGHFVDDDNLREVSLEIPA